MKAISSQSWIIHLKAKQKPPLVYPINEKFAAVLTLQQTKKLSQTEPENII